MQGRLLVVGLERAHYKELLPILSRSQLAVDRMQSGDSAVELAKRVALDLIVIRYPLPDMSLGSFMQGVHDSGSACAKTPLLVLADEARLSELATLLPGGAKQALAVSQPARIIEHVTQLLKLPPRAEVRVPVRLDVKLDGVASPLMCQSENMSEHGMLLKSETSLPLGSKVKFEVRLPGEGTAIQGDAEVVRHTEQDVEQMQGMGLKVTAFRGDGSLRLRRAVVRIAQGQ
jgi:CheY-like chemotaxis protein